MVAIFIERTHADARRVARHLLEGPAAVLLLLAGSLSSAHAASSHIANQVRTSSGPRTIAVGESVTLRFTVVGIHLDVQHIGKRASDHQGHFQLYLDRIPRRAYSKPSLQHWLTSVGATTVSLPLTRGIVGTTGSHRIIAALARNDNVLYRVPPATFKIRVRYVIEHSRTGLAQTSHRRILRNGGEPHSGELIIPWSFTACHGQILRWSGCLADSRRHETPTETLSN